MKRMRWLVLGLLIAVLVGVSVLVATSVMAAQHRFSLRAYDTGPAPLFLFDHRMFHAECVDRPSKVPMNPGGGARMTISPLPAFARTRLEHLTVPRSEAPALTVNADVMAMIDVQGQPRDDWALRMCAMGESDSEAEAQARMQQLAWSRAGSTITLSGNPSEARARTDLMMDAPEDAPVTVYSSYAAVQVQDMTAPVHVAAASGRTTILNSTGRVDATGGIIDYAGAKGTVNLKASMEVDLNLTATRFDGELRATGIRPVRVLLPKGFQSGFQAMVARKQDFVCRADVCGRVTQEKKYGLYVFIYPGDGSSPPDRISLRSENSTVVIDNPDPSKWPHRIDQ